MTNRSFSLAPMSQSFRRVALLVGLAAVYYLAAKLGLRFAFINSSVTTVWPPAGIALAAFVLLGYRVWLAIFGAAFLANVSTTGAVLPSIGIAIGNTVEGLLGSYLVNRFARGCRVFDRVRDIFRFTALAALVSTMVSATIGVSSLVVGGLLAWGDAASWLPVLAPALSYSCRRVSSSCGSIRTLKPIAQTSRASPRGRSRSSAHSSPRWRLNTKCASHDCTNDGPSS